MIRPFRGRSRRGPTGPVWRRVTFRDALAFTTPPLLLLAYLLAASLVDYHESLQFDDWWSRDRDVEGFFTARVKRGLRLPQAADLTLRLDADADDPAILRLSVPRDVWSEIEQNPLVGWGRWVDATLSTAEGSLPVELRKRGDTSLHWTTGKLSFTLQTPKGEHLHGFRESAVSQKSVLTQYVTNSLPGRFGLLTPFTTVTPVFLNNRYYGVFRFVEEVDESFLRRHGRMPGNVFRVDAAERSEYYKGLPRAAFRNPYIWDRVAETEVPGVAPDSALRELLHAVNGSTLDDHLRLMSLVDREEIARLIAVMLVVGDPYHMSGVHNQFWYEDPSTGRLHPIPWDLRLLDLGSRPARVNEFLRAVLRDPFLADLALRAVNRQARDGLYAWSADAAHGVYERFRPHIDYDRLRRETIDDPGVPSEILSGLRSNLDTLARWTSAARTELRSGTTGEGPLVLDFVTAGYAGVDLVELEVDPVAADAESGLALVADRNGNGVPDAEDRVVRGRWSRSGGSLRFEPREPIPLLPGWDTRGAGIRPGTVHYRLFVEGLADVAGAGPEVRPVLRNRVTDERVPVSPWSFGAVVPPNSVFSPWRFPEPGTSGDIRLAGDVELAENLIVPRGGRLVLEPGTRIVLAPDVSILARGRVVARGSARRPIRFLPRDPRRPWGTLALQGPGADSSLFRDVEFRGGGGATVGRIAYTGMVSVYRARDVRFESVRFADNYRSDDALRALHADVTITDCEFLRTNSDAIDFDYSSGAVTDCTFRDARNDAVDLMTSSPAIVRNTMRGSGDKGISIGEASHPLVLDNTIVSGSRGIEVKDASEPLIVHNTILQNEIGVLQQVKNWRYGAGGHAKLALNRIERNNRPLVNDARSRLTALANRSLPDPHVAGLAGTADSIAASGERDAWGADERTAWIQERFGRRDTATEAGARPGPHPDEPLAPRDSVTFLEGFDRGLLGWSWDGGVTGLHRLQRRLVVSAREAPGRALASIRWTAEGPDRPDFVVLEAAGRGLDSAFVALRGTEGDVAGRLRLGPTLRTFAWTALRLPRGRYDSLELVVYPSPGDRRIDPVTGLIEVGSARLELRGAWHYAGGTENARLDGDGGESGP